MKKILMLICCLLFAAALAGCGGDAGKKADDGKVTVAYPPVMQDKGFKDPLVLKQRPQRVVSLTLTPVMTLHELGVKQVGIPKSGVMEWPDNLKDAKQFTVAMKSNFDIESVVALQPDLVMVGYYAKDKYGKLLEEQGIPVYYVDAGPTMDYQSVKELTFALIDAFGKGSEAGKQIARRFEKLEARMTEMRDANKGKTVMVLQSAPPRHFIQTKDGNLGSMLNMLGYTNVYSNDKSRMVMLDKEQAISYNQDVLVCVGAAKDAADHKKVMEEEFAANPAYWQQIKAVREGHVVYLPNKYIVSTGVDVIDNINQLIDILDKQKL